MHWSPRESWRSGSGRRAGTRRARGTHQWTGLDDGQVGAGGGLGFEQTTDILGQRRHLRQRGAKVIGKLQEWSDGVRPGRSTSGRHVDPRWRAHLTAFPRARHLGKSGGCHAAFMDEQRFDEVVAIGVPDDDARVDSERCERTQLFAIANL